MADLGKHFTKQTAEKSGAHPGNRAIQVKICGLTDPLEAELCVDAGADAVGLVFFPKSPRYVSVGRAVEIRRAISDRVSLVGVFVNTPFEAIMATVAQCHLDAVQLHGRESPGLVARLRRENLTVIKVVFAHTQPRLESAAAYAPSAFLVECGGGKLPGGNARPWNWQMVSAMKTDQPVILAGGLSPENVSRAIAAANPDAVDVSSGVESAPGRKDMVKVIDFMAAVAESGAQPCKRRIFANAQ